MSILKSKKYKPLKVIIVKEMRDYYNDPYFIKQAEEAKEFIKKAGIPESFKQKK